MTLLLQQAPAAFAQSMPGSELEECHRGLSACQREQEACLADKPHKSSARMPGSQQAPPWPEGYGKLLKFPFGIADMKTLKEYARAIWQPDGTAATISDEVTDHGFMQQKGARCTSEMVGVHPVGGPGVRWSAKLWADAQGWCIAEPGCTGIMLYVGRHTLNCHHWCGRPQFCSGPIGESDVEASEDWNLFIRLPAAGQPA